MRRMASLEEIRAFWAAEAPHATMTIEQVGQGRARVRQEIGRRHLRPGGTVNGPLLMTLADSATYVAILGEVGMVPLAVTVSLTMNFLRRPRPDRAVVAEAELVKLGKRLAVAEVRVYSEGEAAPVADALVTYSIPPERTTR